eukprot:scaffold500914_cov18-Prasinocladus_malaysianus.AAC.1
MRAPGNDNHDEIVLAKDTPMAKNDSAKKWLHITISMTGKDGQCDGLYIKLAVYIFQISKKGLSACPGHGITASGARDP